jgi:hypothetical protein
MTVDPTDGGAATRTKRRAHGTGKREEGRQMAALFNSEIRRRPTLPGGLPPSTIGAGGLNFRVRNGYGCDPSAIATEICCHSGGAVTGARSLRTP